MNTLTLFLLLCGINGLVFCCTNNGIYRTGSCDDFKTCEKGYILSSDGDDCLPYVTEYYGECYEDAQCDWLGENAHCKFVCKCQDGFRWFLGKCEPYVGLGEKCSAEVKCFDGYDLLSLTCKDETCQCSDGYYLRGDTDCRKRSYEDGICALDMDCDGDLICHIGKCIQAGSQFGEEVEEVEEDDIQLYNLQEVTTCESDEDCKTIENSMCYSNTGTCVCQHGYFLNKDGICAPELGQQGGCTVDGDCKIRPGQCVDGICYCRDYYITGQGNRECIKTMSQNNWNCLSKEWCYTFGMYGFCNSSEICQCSSISNYDATNMWCTPNGNEDPDRCDEDIECRDVLENGHCINEKCDCLENYILNGTKCVPGIGAPCEDTSDCAITNSICLEQICQCDDSYVLWDSACYLQSDGLNATCEVDIQCTTRVPFSECKNSICLCNDQRVEYQSNCIPKREFGSYCNNRLECLVSLQDKYGEEIVCRKHLCQCPTGLSLKGDRCSSGMMTLGNMVLLSVILIKNLFAFC